MSFRTTRHVITDLIINETSHTWESKKKRRREKNTSGKYKGLYILFRLAADDFTYSAFFYLSKRSKEEHTTSAANLHPRKKKRMPPRRAEKNKAPNHHPSFFLRVIPATFVLPDNILIILCSDSDLFFVAEAISWTYCICSSAFIMAPRRRSPKFLSFLVLLARSKTKRKVEKRKFEQTGKREREKGTLYAFLD